MKVAHIVENYYSNPFGGISIWTRRLIEYLDQKNVVNRVYSYDHGIPANIPNIIRSTPNIKELIAYPFLGRKIIPYIDREFDIIHFASPLTLAASSSKTHTIISGHYIISRQSRLLRKYLPYPYKIFFNPLIIKLFEYLERTAYKKGNLIIVPREDYKFYLMEKHHIPEENIVLVNWGIDLDKFKILKNVKKEKIALFIGRGSPTKGFDTFLKAASMIDGKTIAVTSRIMKKERKILNRLNNIEIIHGLNDFQMAEVYNRCSVFVMPSLSESGPLTTFEAMACGLPVVCTPEGSAGQIKNDYNGYVIDFGDYKGFAEKVNYLFLNPDVAAEFGKINRAIVEQNHGFERMCDQVKSVYENLLS